MTSAIGQVRSKRPATWIAAGLAVAISATGVVGYLGWDARQHRCEEAVPVPDPGVEASVVTPAEQAEPWPAEWAIDATDGPGPFGAPRLAVLDIKIFTAPQLAGDDTLLLRRGDVGQVLHAIDLDNGHLRWQRQLDRGWRQPVVPIGDLVTIVDEPIDEALAVVAVDRATGEVHSCLRVGEHRLRSRALVAPVGDELLAVTRPDTGPEATLWLIDPHAGEVTAEMPIEPAPHDLRSAGEVVVASRVPADHRDEWLRLAAGAEGVPPSDLALRAYSVADGAQVWQYAFEVGDGGQPFVHQLVAADEDAVVMIASRFSPWEGWRGDRYSKPALESYLIALDPATGRQQWAQELAPDLVRQPEAQRFGDLVLVRQPDPDGELRRPVAYDVADGAQRWRLDFYADREDGLYLPATGAAGAALLAAIGGLRLVDLADGSSRTVAESWLSLPAVADDTTVGITLGSADAVLVLYDLR
ncbi:PQQ-binding-like beta-propeller repeat protein [Natronosporangium hydrolyticum]|uniref:PQQ-binding-like beta-propeller repeat protein n=1 Tax=Natronosporangium hydrolyticum TaxID=2811111 RepID=A0A895YN98_9ACTN|nr:PQQ-binding-like beta-propeller repeat protein [Natronosporangium hydrolyticum]QSB15590.1 PQQ-binding-like beta-propeller repeat protein [Natronosporangium hydrolyticum]